MTDCDDIVLLFAASEARTLSGLEQSQLAGHLAECDSCRDLTRLPEAGHVIAKIPEDALDDPDLLVLPTVDPVVFTAGRELARGGMGRITRAHDRRLGRDVAIKEVIGPGMRARFEREVTITAQLQHPAIVPVYEAGTWPDGSAFYTMRLVSGGTLADAIAKATTLEQRLVLLPHVLAATDALAYAHSRGIIHRDLKPGNILVGEFGETVVIDWGLAKELRRQIGDAPASASPAAASELTVAGSIVGTPGFMPPEQAAGEDLDERADVYALGAILYNVLSGYAPYFTAYERPSAEQLLDLARARPPARVADLAPSVPADLAAIADKAMARAPADRFPTAQEMAEELRRFSAGQLLRSREYRMRDLLARWVRRHRAAVISGALALVAIAIIGVGAILNVTRSRSAERTARHAAEVAKTNAYAKVLDLLEEEGRGQLLAGDREHALASLTEAYGRGDTTIAVRHMLAAAARDLDPADAALDRQDQQLAGVAFTADGHLVTIDDQRITHWERGRPSAAHAIHASSIASAEIVADGRRAIVADADNQISGYDLERGEQLWHIQDPALANARLVVDPAGARVLVLADSQHAAAFATLRDVETGAAIATLGDGARITGATFSADGTRIALCDERRTVSLWDRAGKRIPFAAPSRCWDMVAFLGTTKLVVETETLQVDLWDLDTKRVVHLGNHGAQLAALAVNPRADRIALADGMGVIDLWTSGGDLVGKSHDHQGNLGHLAFSPDGTLLAGGGDDNRVFIWDTVALELLSSVRDRRERGFFATGELAWSPDSKRFVTRRMNDHVAIVYRAPKGRRIAHAPSFISRAGGGVVVSSDGAHVTTRRLTTGESLHEIASNGAPDAIAVGRDGRGVLTRWKGEWLQFFDTATGAELPVPDAHTPDGGNIWSTTSSNGRFVLETPRENIVHGVARVLATATGKVTGEVTLSHPRAGAVSDDGARFAVLANGVDPVIDDVATRAIVHVAPFDYSPLHADFDPTGARIVFYGAQSMPRVVDARTGTTIANLTGLTGPGELASFDAAGTRVALWGSDRSVRIWEAATGATKMTVDGVSFGGMAFSPDGMRFATGREDGTITIWDVEKGRPIDVLHGDGAVVSYLAWSDDGTRLVSHSSAANLVSIWDVHLR